MRRTALILTLVLLLALTTGGMINARMVGQNCRSISLRYQQPLEVQTAEKAKEKVEGLTFGPRKRGPSLPTGRKFRPR